MNDFHLTVFNNDVGNLSSVTLAAIAVVLLCWLWSVVEVAKHKTEDPFDRIVWLIIILALNFVGTLLYVFFAGSQRSNTKASIEQTEADIKRRANEGTLLD